MVTKELIFNYQSIVDKSTLMPKTILQATVNSQSLNQTNFTAINTNSALMTESSCFYSNYFDSYKLEQPKVPLVLIRTSELAPNWELTNLYGFPFTLNTHMARRTFGSTVTLNNNVPINVVKELLGHASVKQTEAYAITEQATIGREMSLLNKKLNKTTPKISKSDLAVLSRLEKEIQAIKNKYNVSSS